MVDGAALCRGLKERQFLECSAHLRSYDPTALYAATADRCVMENNAAHYPHRTASMISGVSRCLGAVQEAEAASSPPQQRYDWVVLSRLDLLGGVKLCDSSAPKKGGAVCLLPQGVTSIWEFMAAKVRSDTETDLLSQPKPKPEPEPEPEPEHEHEHEHNPNPNPNHGGAGPRNDWRAERVPHRGQASDPNALPNLNPNPSSNPTLTPTLTTG